LSRPSDPMLRWMRQRLKERALTTSAVAAATGLQASRVRQVLSGSEAMTVDEFLQIAKPLDLSPKDFGIAEGDLEEPEPSPTSAPEGGLDPFGNHPEQLVRAGFDLGCDFMFLVRSADLADSGVPKAVLSRYEGRELPIRLDAAYHAYNKPVYTEEGLTLTLSFDALYDCHLPWTAFRQVIFFPVVPEPVEEPAEPPPTDSGPKKPFLRLVE
jgi:hypothetical protein